MRLLAAILVPAVAASGACATGGAVPRPFPGASTSGRTTVSAPAATAVSPAGMAPIVSTALEFLGTPYRNGGSDPAGFDCSGFVQFIFARHGSVLPREVRDQYDVGDQIDLSNIRPGDLLFFETVSRGASHVGVAVGNGQFVHAPSSRGVVRVESYTAVYWARRFVGARRVPFNPVNAATTGTFESAGQVTE